MLVPPVVVNTTARPPVVTLFPKASLARRVSVAIAPDNTLAADAVTMDVTVETAPASAVALKLVAGSPSALASKPCDPATLPSVATVCALPPVSDTTTESATAAPPLVRARNRTGIPFTPSPSPAVTRTRNGWGNAIPTTPLWPAPLTTLSTVGTGMTVTGVESAAPLGARARTVSAARALGARASPVAFTRNPVVSLLLHAT